MTKHLVIVAFTVTFASLVFAQGTAAPSNSLHLPVPVFVTSTGAVNGFTDPNKDNQDTVKDLRDAITNDHKKTLAVTEKRDDAAIVLVVMNRETALKRTVFGAGSPDSTVRVKFIFKDAETEVSASANGGSLSGGPWTRAAGKVANQVEEWVIANLGK